MESFLFIIHPSWSCKLPYSPTKWGHKHPLLWDSGLSTHPFVNDGKWNTCLAHKAIQGRSWTPVIGDAHGNSEAVTRPLPSNTLLNTQPGSNGNNVESSEYKWTKICTEARACLAKSTSSSLLRTCLWKTVLSQQSASKTTWCGIWRHNSNFKIF